MSAFWFAYLVIGLGWAFAWTPWVRVCARLSVARELPELSDTHRRRAASVVSFVVLVFAMVAWPLILADTARARWL